MVKYIRILRGAGIHKARRLFFRRIRFISSNGKIESQGAYPEYHRVNNTKPRSESFLNYATCILRQFVSCRYSINRYCFREYPSPRPRFSCCETVLHTGFAHVYGYPGGRERQPTTRTKWIYSSKGVHFCGGVPGLYGGTPSTWPNVNSPRGDRMEFD